MSKAGVLIWLVIAVLLGGAAIWLLRAPPPTAGPARAPVVDAPLARITELAVTPAGGPVQRITRDAASGDWSLAGPGGDWPVQIGNIQAALRLLATLEGHDADAGAKAPGPGDAEVRLTLDDGTFWTLWLAPRTLAGERLARIQPPGNAPARTVLVDATLFDALVESGPNAWRVPLALSDLTTDVSRVTLTALNGRIALGRVNGRWALQEPVAAPAGDDAIQSLFKTFSSVRIVRFLETPPDPAAAHFEAPIATATLMTERRLPKGEEFETVTTIRTLTVGGPASIDGKELYARVDVTVRRPREAEPRTSSTPVTISRETVDAISMDPVSYLNPEAVATPSGEVGTVDIVDGDLHLAYSRTIDGWETATPPGTSGDNERIGLLLKLLCEQPAASRVLRPQPVPAFVTVRLGSLGGSPLAELSMGLSGTLGQPAGSESRPNLCVISGEVARLYDPAPWADLLGWITPTPAR